VGGSGSQQSALHNSDEVVASFEDCDVLKGISGDNQQIGQFAGFHGADFVAASQQFGAIFRGAGEHFKRAEADVFDEEGQFASVVAVWVPGKTVVAAHAEAATGFQDHAGTFSAAVECFLVPIDDSL